MGSVETQTIAVAPAAYVASQVPDGGSIRSAGDGIVLVTATSATESLSVSYALDSAAIPVGAVIEKVDTRVCGHGEGQFWRIEGPTGSTPAHHESTDPDADGCWHFTGAPGDDLTVTASTMLESRLYIQSVEYTLTIGR